MKTTCLLRYAATAMRIIEDEISTKSNQLLSYTAPRWASKLKKIPTKYIQLAEKPTPIQEWNLTAVPGSFKLDVKRDDLTGKLLSGNKIRKLEFIFADAIDKKSTCVVTWGDLQSNHCRTTAIAAKEVGLGCHLLLRSRNKDSGVGSNQDSAGLGNHQDSETISANMRLCGIHGADSYTVPYQSFAGGLNARLKKLADQLRKKGERPYIISRGGSEYLGTFGIINSFNELVSQGVLSNYDDIVVASSSGGTFAGLCVANQLTGDRLRIHGISLSDDYDLHQHVEETLQSYGLRAKAAQIGDFIEGCTGNACFKPTTTRELNNLVNVDSTLKAVNVMLREMKENPKRFKGNRVLYIHTGGTYSVFDCLTNNITPQSSAANFRMWKNLEDNPLIH